MPPNAKFSKMLYFHKYNIWYIKLSEATLHIKVVTKRTPETKATVRR